MIFRIFILETKLIFSGCKSKQLYLVKASMSLLLTTSVKLLNPMLAFSVDVGLVICCAILYSTVPVNDK